MEPRRHDLPFDLILHIRRQGVKRLPKLPPIGAQFLHADPHITMRNAGLTPLEVLGSTRVTSMGLRTLP